jgi:predicted peptidase
MPTQETGFLNRVVAVDGTDYRYQVYLPREYEPGRDWPVVLFLHGAGERGSDGLAQTQVGIATAIRRHSDRFPCIVVFPQCRSGRVWTGEMETQALRALDATMEEFNCDRSRVYLTGISMGGYGTWSIAGRHPGRFAALVVVCGGITPPLIPELPPGTPHLPLETPPPGADPYLAAARRIGRTPVWVFHGAEDPIIPVSESTRMVEAIEAVGGDARYTQYPLVAHDSWTPAYAERSLPDWLFSRRLEE